MKLAYIVVNGYYCPPKLSLQLEAYSRVFSERGIHIEVLRSSDMHVYLENGKMRCGLDPDALFVIYLDKDIHIARLLAKKYRLFNSAEAIELCDDKMKTHIALESVLDMPATVSAPLNYIGAEDEGFIRRIEKRLGYPVVVKESYGSYGKQVHLAEDYAALKSLWSSLKSKPHLYQQFIETSKGRDIRITVVGGRAVSAIMRISDTDFRSNLELGGHAESFAPDKRYLEMAETAARVLSIDFGGIDILIGKEGAPIFCEANSNAFFQTSEQLCKIDITSLIADHIISKTK